MLSVKAIIALTTAKHGLTVRGNYDSRLLLFKRVATKTRYSFLINGLNILASRKITGEELIIEQFDLFNRDSLIKLNSFCDIDNDG